MHMVNGIHMHIKNNNLVIYAPRERPNFKYKNLKGPLYYRLSVRCLFSQFCDRIDVNFSA